MPQTIETTVYTIDELSDDAKVKARAWYCECLDAEDLDGAMDLIREAAEMLGIIIERGPYWTLHCQGSGASFDGSYYYAKGSAKRFRDERPMDTELQRIADDLFTAQRKEFYGVSAIVKARGHYHHLEIETHHDNGYSYYYECPDVEQALRDFASWAHRVIEREWDYLTSDQNVDETIEANEYTFTESGARL